MTFCDLLDGFLLKFCRVSNAFHTAFSLLGGHYEVSTILGEVQYGALSNVIARKTFGLDTAGHKKHKGLKSQNLRDHMTDLELIFTMLGEKSTTQIAMTTDAQGYKENAEAAASGGKIAGEARRSLEEKLGRSVVSKQNFLKGGSRENDPQLLTEKNKK